MIIHKYDIGEVALKKMRKKALPNKYIVIHCSLSDVKEHDSPRVIDEWHREKKYDCIGYHYFISKDGTIWACRPSWAVGAHVLHGFNKNSMGICLAGMGGESFTEDQIRSLVDLIKKMRLGDEKVVGHCELDKRRTCPNFDVGLIRGSL